MTTTVKAPSIQGSNHTTEEEVSAQQVKDEVVEQASQMDIEVELPTEVVTPSRDVADKPLETRVEETKTANTKTISAAKAASLEKARAARKMKREREKATGLDAAEGGPAPDLLNSIETLINNKFSDFQTSLKSFMRIEGQPMPQANPTVAPTQVTAVALPTDDTTVHLVPTAPKVGVPLSTQSVQPVAPSTTLDEQERYTKRFKPLLDTYQFVNPPMQQRVAQDATMGQYPGVSSSITPILF